MWYDNTIKITSRLNQGSQTDNRGRKAGKETTMVEQIRKINEVAQENFDRAKGMLDMLNELTGLKLGWLAKRVVVFDNPDSSVAERYASCHDAVTEYA